MITYFIVFCLVGLLCLLLIIFKRKSCKGKYHVDGIFQILPHERQLIKQSAKTKSKLLTTPIRAKIKVLVQPLGIYLKVDHSKQFKNGFLIYFDLAKVPQIYPPAYGVLKTYARKKNHVILEGELVESHSSIKQLFRIDLLFKKLEHIRELEDTVVIFSPLQIC